MWNVTGTTLRIVITPPFWQTLWFRALGVLLLLGAATAAYKARIASLLKVERMRLSIASDLHDDIGSSLASIAVLADLVRNRTRVPKAASEHLLDISRTARSTSEALRDIVWFINPEHDSAANIIDRLQDIAAKMLAGVTYTFQRDDRSSALRLPMAFRRDVVLVYKEILSNIGLRARTMSPARIDLTAEAPIDRFHDGGGFDAAQPPAGMALPPCAEGAHWEPRLRPPGKGPSSRLRRKYREWYRPEQRALYVPVLALRSREVHHQ
jgi:hypothetical protein